jgi:hypothetical protein
LTFGLAGSNSLLKEIARDLWVGSFARPKQEEEPIRQKRIDL